MVFVLPTFQSPQVVAFLCSSHTVVIVSVGVREAVMGLFQVVQHEKLSLNLRSGHGVFGGTVQFQGAKYVLSLSLK